MFSLDTRRFSLEARCCLSSYVVHLAELHHCVPDKTPSCRCTRVQETDVKLKDNSLSLDQILILSPCSRLSSSVAGTLAMLGPEGRLFHRHARTWTGRLWRWMWSEDGSHEFGSFPLKKKLLYLSHRCSASWFFSRSLVQNPFPFKTSILDQSSIWISLATPTSLAGTESLPHPAWSSPLPVVWFPLGAVSFPPPPADLEFLTLFTAFLCLHFHFFTFTFTFFNLLSLSHFRSEANLLTLGCSHRSRHLVLVMEEKRLLQPDVYHQQTDYTNTL